MLKDEFRKLLSERIQVHPNNDYETDRYWKLETDLLSKDIHETIEFLDSDCTADEFSWISEIFESIVEKTQSKEFIECLWRVAEKFPEECETYHVHASIRFAEEYLY